MYFFGAPVSPEKLKDYTEHHAMTCARPPAIPRARMRHTRAHTALHCIWIDEVWKAT